MKTLKEMYDTAELCGYIPTSIWGGHRVHRTFIR